MSNERCDIIIIIIIIIIILIKNNSTGPSGKNKKLFINCFLSTPLAPALLKTEENTTQASSQWVSATMNSSSVPVSNVHSVRKVIPHSNLGRQETPFKLGGPTP